MQTSSDKAFLKNRGLWYLCGGIVCTLSAILSGWLIAWLFYWGAFCCFYLALAYLFSLNRLLFKTPEGRVPKWLKLLLLPFFWGSYFYNWQARKRDTVEPFHEIKPNLFLGRRLLHSDVDELKTLGINSILDVTAEYDTLEIALLGEDVTYLNVPVFDHGVLSLSDLHRAVLWIDKQISSGRKVIIHCALGRGRSATALVAYLLFKNPSKDVEEVVAEVKALRSTVSPNFRQTRNLEQYKQSKLIQGSTLACLVFNPVSGQGDNEAALEEIKSLLEPYLRLSILRTEAEVSIDDLVRKALDDGAKLIIAYGGDGTVSDVAGSLIGKNATLGIIPGGTANALASTLYGVSASTESIRTSCERILVQKTTTIDTAQVNGNPFLQIVGVGFECVMIEGAKREVKDNWGVLGYLFSGYKAIYSAEAMCLRVTIDDDLVEIETTSFVVANAAPFFSLMAQGGGQPKVSDGHLDITWLEGQGDSVNRAPPLLELLRAGLSDTEAGDGIHHRRGKRILIEAKEKIAAVVDGETGWSTPLDIQVNPQSLQVLINRETSEASHTHA